MNMTNWVGQTIGQYRIEAPLDAGGMGQVFRGTHTYLNRPAAIKIMRQHLANDPTFRTRFLREARAAATLKHPNIIEIYDFDEQDGLLYLVMELITDGSLRTLLQQQSGQSYPLTLGLDLIRQAAEGLATAHAIGLVHRDIKPDNLLLTRLDKPGENYQVKITDFGLARLADGNHVTVANTPIGTIAYMSPEQCRGETVDGRSDLYCLGVVLYEVMTGHLPFQIDNYHDGLYKHLTMEPPSPRLMRPDLPPSVEETILRCLAKKPEQRFQSCRDLARVLASLSHEEEITFKAIPAADEPTSIKDGDIARTGGATPFDPLHISTSSSDVPTSIKDGETINPTVVRDTSRQTPGTYRTSTSDGSQRIGLFTSSKNLTITPGQPTQVQVTITNLGQIVDWFTLSVEGVPENWVRLPPEEVQLNPGTQETVDLSINVARIPNNLAQEYPVTLRARSRENPSEAGVTRMLWTVQPFKEDSLLLEPRRARGRGAAMYKLTLRNGGNTQERYDLRGDDDEQKLHYQFDASAVELPAGQETRVGLLVATNKRFIGSEQRNSFQIHARPVSGAALQTSAGEFINRALLPTWIIPVALALVLVTSGIAAAFAGVFPLSDNGKQLVTPNTSATTTALAQANFKTFQAQVNATATTQAQTSHATATAQAQTSHATATAQVQNTNPTAQPQATTPTFSNYSTITPGKGCDTQGATWIAFQSTTHCTSNGTIITKTQNTDTNFHGWGEQEFHPSGQTFPANYSVGVTISALTDPTSTVAACAGITVHNSQDGGISDDLQICSSGVAGIVSVKNGALISNTPFSVPQSSIYVLNAHVTSNTITLTINNGQQYTATAYSSSTSFIGLSIFWDETGANGVFSDFLYTPNA